MISLNVASIYADKFLFKVLQHLVISSFFAKVPMLKLPKGIVTHSRASEIEAKFRVNLRPLSDTGRLEVPHWPFDEVMRVALLSAYNNDHLIQGLESIDQHLDAELKGLKALQSRPGQDQKQRLSRLLLLSNDGSERFYHSAESILTRHSDRILACVLDATADQLGRGLTKKSNPTKALLICDRKALEQFLIAIGEPNNAQGG